jgi:Winged helix DNA-binding domain
VRTLTPRELNRTLLARQLLLERRRLPLARAVSRLVALQAQYAPSPYVALLARLDGFRKEQLTRALARGSIVKAGCLRATLHVTTRADFPWIFAAYADAGRGRTANLGADLGALWEAIGDEPRTGDELFAIAQEVLGTDDVWTRSFALRVLPGVRTAPLGEWPHTKVSPWVRWTEPLPDPAEAAARVVRAYLAGYGPAAREDVEQFTFFKVRQITPALDGLRTFLDEQGRTLYDLPRAPLAGADVPAPARFLPPFDSIILAHRDRSRILPDDYRDVVINKANATTRATFTVDGLIAGSWRIERIRGRQQLRLEPFAPLPARVRREVDEEGSRLLAFYAP